MSACRRCARRSSAGTPRYARLKVMARTILRQC
jgi:hypothetical protein